MLTAREKALHEIVTLQTITHFIRLYLSSDVTKSLPLEEFEQKVCKIKEDSTQEALDKICHEGNKLILNDRFKLHLAFNAIKFNHVPTLTYLIEKGLDLESFQRKIAPPLVQAGRYSTIEIIKILIRAGADVNSVDSEGWTPIMAAACNGRSEIVKAFIDLGADVNMANDAGWTPLFWAADCNHLYVAKILIENNADLNAIDQDGKTARSIAKEKGFFDLSFMLEMAGAKDKQYVGISTQMRLEWMWSAVNTVASPIISALGKEKCKEKLKMN